MPNIKNIVTTLTLGGLLAGGVIGLDGVAMATSAGAIGSVNTVSSAWGRTSDWGWGWAGVRGGHFHTGGCHWRSGERFHARIRCGRHCNRDINTFNGLTEDPLAIVRQLTN